MPKMLSLATFLAPSLPALDRLRFPALHPLPHQVLFELQRILRQPPAIPPVALVRAEALLLAKIINQERLATLDAPALTNYFFLMLIHE
jgi:hypothetical protein